MGDSGVFFRENFPLVIPAEACSWSLNHSPLEVRRCCLKAGVGSVYLITDTPTGMHHVGSAYAIQRAFSGGESGAFSEHVFGGIFQAFSAVKWLGKFHIERQAAALHPPSRPASGNGGPRLTRGASGLSGAPRPPSLVGGRPIYVTTHNRPPREQCACARISRPARPGAEPA